MAKEYNRGFRLFHYSLKNGGRYSTPAALPGAIKIAFKPQTGARTVSVRYTDGSAATSSQIIDGGTTAAVSVVSLPEDFLTDVLGYYKATDGSMYQGQQTAVHFALMYETQGIEEPTRHILLDCVCTKPEFDASTISSTPSIDTRSLQLILNPITINGKQYYSRSIKQSDNSELFETWFGLTQGENEWKNLS